jgi:hypothetical protein
VWLAASDTIWNGVAVSNDDWVFVLFSHNEGHPDTHIGELKNGTVTPYPNGVWNSWKQECDPAKTLS